MAKIAAPTLLITGKDDEIVDFAEQPLKDGIPKVKWVKFEESSHMPYWEESERYNQVVGDFLSTTQ